MSMIILKKNLTVFSVDYCSLCIDCSSGGGCFTHTFSRFIPQQTFSLPFLLFGLSLYIIRSEFLLRLIILLLKHFGMALMVPCE